MKAKPSFKRKVGYLNFVEFMSKFGPFSAIFSSLRVSTAFPNPSKPDLNLNFALSNWVAYSDDYSHW